MRITTIEGRGLKAQDFLIDLSGRDALVAAWRSGKSTTRLALQFLATGENGDVAGRTLADAGILVRDRSMSVRATWADGSFATRYLSRKGAGWTMTADASWLPDGASQDDAKEAIRARFGASEDAARQNVNFTEFVGLTGPRQASEINALLDGSGMSDDELVQRATTLSAVRLQAEKKDTALPADPNLWGSVHDGAMAQCPAAVQESHVSVSQDFADVLREKGLSGAITWANNLRREAAATTRQRSAARTELEDRIGGLGKPGTTLDALASERQQQSDSIASKRQQVRTHEEAQAALNKADSAVVDCRRVLDEQGDIKVRAARTRESVAGLVMERDALTEPAAIPAPAPVETDPEALKRADALEAEAGALKQRAAEQQPEAPAPVEVDQAELDRASALEADADALDRQANEIQPDAPAFEERLSAPNPESTLAALQQARDEGDRAVADEPWAEVREIADALYPADAPREGNPGLCDLSNRLRDLADNHGMSAERVAGLERAVADSKSAHTEATTEYERVRIENEARGVRNTALRDKYDADSAESRSLREQATAKNREASVIRTAASGDAAKANAERREAYDFESGESRRLMGQATAKNRDAAQIRTAAMAVAAEANAENRAAYKAEYSTRAAEVDAVVQERVRLNGEITRLGDQADKLDRDHAQAQSALKEAEARREGMGVLGTLDVDDVNTQIAVAEADIIRLDELKRGVEQSDARVREMLEITAEVEKAQAEQKVAAAFAWVLPKLRDDDLAQRVGPILERMTTFLTGAGCQERPFMESAKGKVQYGWTVGGDHPFLEAGTRVSGLSLSGAESVLFNTAFAFAIIDLRGPDTSVLALELDDLDPEPAAKFWRGCAAIADSIDNILVCTNRKANAPTDGWTLHALGARTEAAA